MWKQAYVAVVSATVVGWGCAGGSSSGEAQAARPTETTGSAPVVINESLPSANALYREYVDNPIDADDKYKGQTVALEAYRGDIVRLTAGGAAVHVEDRGNKIALIAQFPDEGELRGIGAGQMFRFQCVVEKFEFNTVWMEFCRIPR